MVADISQKMTGLELEHRFQSKGQIKNLSDTINSIANDFTGENGWGDLLKITRWH